MYGMTTAHPSNYTKGRSARIEFLALHYTAGHNDSAAGNLRYFASPRGASAHYFVDRDGWRQSVSDEDTAWSVGTAGIYTQKHPRCHNGNSISIEMCCRYDAGRYWLEDVVVAFIKIFLLASGSLKEVAGLYGVTYPTVRLRLDRLIQKIHLSEDTAADPYVALVKRLAVADKLDFDTAKLLIQSYKKTKGEDA